MSKQVREAETECDNEAGDQSREYEINSIAINSEACVQFRLFVSEYMLQQCSSRPKVPVSYHHLLIEVKEVSPEVINNGLA